MPPLEVEVKGVPASGYMLISPFSFDSTAEYASGLFILDSAASPIVYKPNTNVKGPTFQQSWLFDFNLQKDGSLSYFQRRSGGRDVIHFLDDDLQIIDSQKCGNNRPLDAHDVIRDADGTTHLMCFEERTMDVSHFTTTQGKKGSQTAMVLGNILQRIDSKGKVLWTWKSLDHFALDDFYEEYFHNPDHVDHTHFNSLDIDSDGNYLVSSRHLNEVTKINSQTGKVIWRFGGKQNEFTLMGDTIPFTGQHDARRLPNGNISLFDNATHTPNGTARSIEYQLDTVNMTATTVWQKKLASGHKSLFIGNTQLLSNGHRLIDWGGARPFSETISVEEVDGDGKTVLSIDFPENFISYRARKFSLPFLQLPEIICKGTTLEAPKNHSYFWSTGDTTQSIVVGDTGNYWVWVESKGVYWRSKSIYVDDASVGCPPSNTPQNQLWSEVEIYPNPATEKLRVNILNTNKPLTFQFYNLLGKPVSVYLEGQTKNQLVFNIQHLEPGIYIATINQISKRVVVE